MEFGPVNGVAQQPDVAAVAELFKAPECGV
jgi:hypothetical protein